VLSVLIGVFVAVGVVVVILAVVQSSRRREDQELESGGSWGDQVGRDKDSD
jgi:hypothetical protein